MKKQYRIKTKSEGFYNITSFVRQTVLESGVKEGIAVIFTPHNDAGILISDLDEDILQSEELALIKGADFKGWGNDSMEEAHIKSMLAGVSKTVIVSESEPVLGKNQGVVFGEFNPGEERTFYVKVVKG